MNATITEETVRRLLTAQFPDWARLPLHHVASAGTDHALYRLGDDLAVRLPRHPDAARQVEKEQCWLPKLAPHLPLAVPVPSGHGHPDTDYPFPWSIVTWLEGDSADHRPPDSFDEAADTLGAFVAALR